MTHWMNIGQAADAAGVSAKMIRHHEQIGLMPAASRTDAGYRQYGERDISILRFIRQARRLGFSMKQIAGLVSLWSNRERTSREVKTLAQGHLAMLDEKMREIAAMQAAPRRASALACRGSRSLRSRGSERADPRVEADLCGEPVHEVGIAGRRHEQHGARLVLS